MASNWENFRGADEERLAVLVRTKSARQLVDGLFWIPMRWRVEGEPYIDPHIARDVFAHGLMARTPEVRQEFVERVYASDWFFRDGNAIVDDLVDLGGAVCASAEYIRYVTECVVSGQHPAHLPMEKTHDAGRIARTEKRFLDTVLWQLFTTEGAGRLQGSAWFPSLGEFLRRRPELRPRVLDELLTSLLRDFSATDIAGYLELLRFLEMRPAEIALRQARVIRVLTTIPGTGVTAAQELLVKAVGELTESADLFAASAAVATRPEKKQTLAQVALLEKVAAAHPELRDQVAKALDPFFESPHLEVAQRASRFGGRPAPRPAVEAPASGADEAIVVPGPRRTPRTPVETDISVPADPNQLAELLAHLLEVGGSAEQVVAALRGAERLAGVRPSSAAALLARAKDPERASMQGFEVGAIVEGWLERRRPNLRTEEYVIAHDYSRLRTSQLGQHLNIKDVRVPFWTPTTLYRQWVTEFIRAPRRRPVTRIVDSVRRDGATHTPSWRRVVVPAPSEASRLEFPGYYFRVPHPYVLWVDDAAPTRGITARVFDLRVLGRDRFVMDGYAEEARQWWTRRFATQLDWWRWLFVLAPDHLAAHGHLALLAASRFDNVPSAPIVDGIAASVVPLGPPSWSALGIALADKTAEGRARAAEAVATLAETGFLEPGGLASAITELLGAKAVPGSRIASSLADAASISPISGWRVLETLTTMLPELTGPATARFIEVAARQSRRFGVPVEIPEPLTTKKAGAIGAAVRSLAAVGHAPTAELRDAARQAGAALL